MKRAFLQNFKVGDQPLPKEVIDAIMAENGRDIEAAKAHAGGNGGSDGKMFTQEDVNRIVSERLAKEREKFQASNGLKDMEQLQSEVQRLQEELEAKDAAHKQFADHVFTQRLETAIQSARGRSSKAICAMLDMDALRASENQEADIKAALDGLKRDNGFLFEADPVPPPYSAGAGTGLQFGSGSTAIAEAFKPPKI